MEWYYMLLLVFTIPIILFVVAFVVFLSVGGIYSVVKDAREMREVRRKAIEDSMKMSDTSEEGIEPVTMQKAYLICERCSKTVDIGLDGPYPKPVFMRGYCATCSRFLFDRAVSGEREGRLESASLLTAASNVNPELRVRKGLPA